MQLTRISAVSAAVAILTTAALAGCGGKSDSVSATSSQTPVAVVKHQAAPPPPPTCPLTGAPRAKGQNVKRPALAVKIDNVSDALPQSGVNNADIVVEELVEGGLTRLMAIYQCDQANTVGPIRSLRISDADLLALLHGSILGYSGANPKDMPPIVAHSDAVLISQDANPQYFYRSSAHAAPHNVYSSTKRIVQAGISRRASLKAPTPLFSYGAIDASAKKAHVVSMSWPAASALWRWTKNEWLRTQGGSPDRLSDGSQISAKNVVVLNVNIASTGLHDVLGTPSPEDVTVGSNRAWVLRDGKVINGTWHRASIAAGWTLRDKHGHLINLAPGRTWVELLPTGRSPSVH
ncbi:MAG: DUF3048 domain-containing protein [Frankiaceae bacterium]|nr:DUF3048 domain-containing protein [Frankiaceae bacterium]MBV9871326.1 DUF3048 domain-containing protein [Frankiaceae bacterium]